MLNETELYIYGLMLVFARVSMLFAFMPALSYAALPMRFKASMAIAISFLILSSINLALPQDLIQPDKLLYYLAYEIFVGIYISFLARFYFMSSNMLGSIILTQSGLGSASFFDPYSKVQTDAISSFLMMMVTLLILAYDLHHIFIKAIIDSYNIFIVGGDLNLGDMVKMIIKHFNSSFILAFKLSSPFILVNLIMLIFGGILNRLIPAFPVFFVLLPGQIFVMFVILIVAINQISMVIINHIINLYN